MKEWQDVAFTDDREGRLFTVTAHPKKIDSSRKRSGKTKDQMLVLLFDYFAGMHTKWHLEKSEKQQCFLPDGKAEDTAISGACEPQALYQGFAVAGYGFAVADSFTL